MIALDHGTAFGRGGHELLAHSTGATCSSRGRQSSEPIIDQDLRLFHGRNGRAILGLVPAERNASSQASAGLTFWDVDAGRPIDGFEPEPGSSGPDWVFDGKSARDPDHRAREAAASSGGTRPRAARCALRGGRSAPWPRPRSRRTAAPWSSAATTAASAGMTSPPAASAASPSRPR